MSDKLKLAVYAICRNEIEHVENWYNSVREADEVIVLDTGSTDGTPEKLEELGAKVYRDAPTVFRFDEARNVALSHVSPDADICFSIDLDEWFEDPGWCEAVKTAWRKTTGCNSLEYRFVMNRVTDSAGNRTDTGVWWKENCHTRRGWHWEYPVHNLLCPDVGTHRLTGRVPESVSLVHHQTPRADRADRLPLHWLNVAERPNAPRPLYYLGREYIYREDYPNALRYLGRYLDAVGEQCWHDEKGQALLFAAVASERLGDMDSAELYALRAVAETHGREPLLYLSRLYYGQGKWHPAKFWAEQALPVENNHAYFRDDNAYGAAVHDLLANVYWKLGDKDKARKEAEICLSYDPNNQQFRDNVLLAGGALPDLDAFPDKITAAYSVNADWLDRLAVSLFSLLRHNAVEEVVILTECGATDPAIERLCESYGARVRWVNYTKLIASAFRPECPNLGSEYTNATLGRIFLPRVCGKPRILYLDTDTIVHGDLSDLWKTDLAGAVMAGAPKTNWPGLDAYCRTFAPDGIPCYVNAGVLLMDLNRFRALDLDLAAIKLLHGAKLKMPDQDALNAVCAGRVKAVDNAYNSSLSCGFSPAPKITHFAAVLNVTAGETWQETAEALKQTLHPDEKGSKGA